VVEVDASTTGVGAVHSQLSGEPPRFHPCAYYSRKLTPAEQNYGIGNRELLAIKLALEEWHHWLEGSNHPFIDHNPPSQITKILNSSTKPRSSIPAKPTGLCFPPGSTSPSPIALEIVTAKLTPYIAFTLLYAIRS